MGSLLGESDMRMSFCFGKTNMRRFESIRIEIMNLWLNKQTFYLFLIYKSHLNGIYSLIYIFFLFFFFPGCHQQKSCDSCKDCLKVFIETFWSNAATYYVRHCICDTHDNPKFLLLSIFVTFNS